MSISNQLIEQLKAAYCLPSSYAVAKKLGVAHSAVHRWETGKTIIDDSIALEFAELLELDPLQVMASLNLERAKKQNKENLVEFWSKYIH